MRKFLSIIIPRYKETEQELFLLLSSINGQIGVDFREIEVIVSTDGGGEDILSDNFIKLFENLQIKQVKSDVNVGPGITRQNGLDVALGDYVMFCDADDTLHNVGAIGGLIEAVETEAPDILTSSWLEEIKLEDGSMRYFTHANDNTWMHGKLLRRKFLQSRNIRFHPDFRVHEDTYLLSVAASLADKTFNTEILSYVWKWHDNSITRRNGGIYTFNSMPTFVNAVTESFRILDSHKKDDLPYKVVQFTFYTYFSMHQPEWLDQSKNAYRIETEQSFADSIKPFWHYYTDQTPEYITKLYNDERNRRFSNLIENETLYQWFDRLGLNY